MAVSSLKQVRPVLLFAGVDVSTLGVLQQDVLSLFAPGPAAAIALWKTLRALVPQTGHWPVVLGEDDEIASLLEGMADAEPLVHRRAAALKEIPDPARWHEDEYGERPSTEASEPDDGWPSPDKKESWVIPRGMAKAPRSSVRVALVPTAASWEVPLHLCFGGFNSCPASTQHASLLRRWSEEYGAEVFSMSGDTFEVAVTRPPQTHGQAMTLAREQSLYCDDLVSQGVGSVGNLAAALWRAPSWFFWWD